MTRRQEETMVLHSYLRSVLILALGLAICACSSYQPTKEVWKTTKGLWNTYVSPAARVDYEEKGELSPQARALSTAMIGIDRQLGNLERTMQNADRPPTREWLSRFLSSFPWISGFAGVKYDGTILGQEPPESLKELDFNGLLYEDRKQNSRALRADVQPSPLGPEVMLAAPLYDGMDFLGLVVAYFDMRNLMQYAKDPKDIVILCPTALLWPGKYEFTATPLASTDWSKVVTESTYGTCTNSSGTFFYMVRYLGNLPLIFATPEKGNFPEGDGSLEQGFAVFPKEREKLPPPPLPERKPGEGKDYSSFGASEEEPEVPEQPEGMEQEGQPAQEAAPAEQQPRQRRAGRQANEIEPGSRESLLLKGGRGAQRRRVQERMLEGENIEIERVERARTPRRLPEPTLDLIPDSDGPTLSGGRPSPFGPREEKKEPQASEQPASQQKTGTPAADPAKPEAAPAKPEPANDNGDTLADGEPAGGAEQAKPAETPESKPADAPKAEERPADAKAEPEKKEDTGPRLLPGGRPSPFGPRN